eukprot:sb/3465366/
MGERNHPAKPGGLLKKPLLGAHPMGALVSRKMPGSLSKEEIDGLRGALDKNESILRYRTESNTARRPVTAAQLSGQKVSSAASRFVEVELPKRAPSAPAGQRQRSPPSPAGRKKEEKSSSRMEQYFAKTDPTSLRNSPPKGGSNVIKTTLDRDQILGAYTRSPRSSHTITAYKKGRDRGTDIKNTVHHTSFSTQISKIEMRNSPPKSGSNVIKTTLDRDQILGAYTRSPRSSHTITAYKKGRDRGTGIKNTSKVLSKYFQKTRMIFWLPPIIGPKIMDHITNTPLDVPRAPIEPLQNLLDIGNAISPSPSISLSISLPLSISLYLSLSSVFQNPDLPSGDFTYFNSNSAPMVNKNTFHDLSDPYLVTPDLVTPRFSDRINFPRYRKLTVFDPDLVATPI